MGAKALENAINAIQQGLYDKVVLAASEAIKSYNGQPIIGKPDLAGFIGKITENLVGMGVLKNDASNAGHILLKEDALAGFTGEIYPAIWSIGNDAANIELVKGDLNNTIGIQEMK